MFRVLLFWMIWTLYSIPAKMAANPRHGWPLCVFIIHVWGILWTASSSECPVGYCIVYLLKSTLKNRKCQNIHISSKVCQILESKTQHAVIAVITQTNTSNIKIPTFFFFGKNWGMMLHLSSAPLKRITIFFLTTTLDYWNIYYIAWLFWGHTCLVFMNKEVVLCLPATTLDYWNIMIILGSHMFSYNRFKKKKITSLRFTSWLQ